MTEYRRLVLELGHGDADVATMRQAAAFARLLGADLHALFVEDEILLHASALPFTREISPLSLQWRNLAPDRMEAEMRGAAENARRHLMEMARSSGVRQTFEVRRGDFAVNVTEICVSNDIVVLPASRGEKTHGFDRLRVTACQSAASMLILPPGSVRQHGLIVAVATDADDPSLAIARRIAERGREMLLVLAPPGFAGDGDTRTISGDTAQDIMAALAETRERLIVMTRPGSLEAADLGAALSVGRGVPVLIVEPGPEQNHLGRD